MYRSLACLSYSPRLLNETSLVLYSFYLTLCVSHQLVSPQNDSLPFPQVWENVSARVCASPCTHTLFAYGNPSPIPALNHCLLGLPSINMRMPPHSPWLRRVECQSEPTSASYVTSRSTASTPPRSPATAKLYQSLFALQVALYCLAACYPRKPLDRVLSEVHYKVVKL